MNFKKEIGVGVFFLLFAIAYYIGTLGISTFDPFAAHRDGIQLTSQSVPQTLAVLIGSLGIIHIIGNALKLWKIKAETGEVSAKKPFTFKFERTQQLMVITVALICAYIFFYNRLGFIVSSTLYLLVQMFVLIPSEKKKKWAPFTVCFSLGISVIVYLIFTRAISMFLPRGIIVWL